jgi:beta-lactamase superfamily II metal-dependent hydrolase
MPNYNYNVYPVGDGLFSTFSKFRKGTFLERSIFDIGHGRPNNSRDYFQGIPVAEYDDAKTLVLSHFHLDHFVGLENVGDRTLQIEKFVIPMLPFDELYARGVIAFTTIQLFYFGEVTGFYETDIIRLLARKNNRPFTTERKARGEQFVASQTDFKVIWPDPYYSGKLHAVQDGINDIISIAETNPTFKKFYDEVTNSGLFDSNVIESTPGETEEVRRVFQIVLKPEERAALQRASRRLVSKANDICLAFHDKENKFLSLGDLSNTALDRLFEMDFQNPILFEVVLSAHHGTHYTNNLNWLNIKASVVVHSAGIQMTRYFKIAYRLWSDAQHNTLNNGLFNSQNLIFLNVGSKNC